MNRYIKAMEIGLANEKEGISYFELFYAVKGTKERVSSKEAEISFFMWFLQNFHNTEDRHYPEAELIKEYRVWLIKEAADNKYHDFAWLETRHKNLLNSKWFLNGQAAKQYLDYEELQQSVKSAKIAQTASIEANKKSTISIRIAIAALIVSGALGVVQIVASPNPPYDVKVIEDKTKVKDLQNENDQLKEKLFKAEMMVKVLEDDPKQQ